jgi:hypothetical protein
VTRTAALGLLLWGLGVAVAGGQELTQVRAVLHVHTDFSTGDLSLDEIATRAERQGIGAVFLADNLLLRVEYGVPPFRSLLRVSREEASVLGRGVERYLARVAEAGQRHPSVVLVPGVEVMPHYRWTGSALDGDLTVHNLQKNILVLGLTDPVALRSLPAVGSAATRTYSLESVVEAVPVLPLVLGLWLVVRPARPRPGRGRPRSTTPRQRALGLALSALGLAAAWRGFPFAVDALSPYRDLGIAPYQDLIDIAETRGAAAVWSFPDAFDYGEERILGFRVARRTEPYGDDLLRTYRYTGFGGVYEDTVRFAAIGGGWDYLLGQYARGERSRPAWLVGESGFHGDGDGKWIGAAETVLLVPTRTDAALLEALRRGRAYGVLRTDRTNTPVLERFTLTAGGALALSGETIRAEPGAALEVRVGIRMSDGSEQPIRVTLVRNGGTTRVWTGTTPLDAAHLELFDGTPAYFRLDVRGPRTSYMLSNPIFAMPTGE